MNELPRRKHRGIKDKTKTNPRKEIKTDPRVGELDPLRLKFVADGASSVQCQESG